MLSEAVLKPTPSLEKILSGEELNFKEGVELMKEENFKKVIKQEILTILEYIIQPDS